MKPCKAKQKKKIILLCTTTKQDYLWVIQHWNDKRHECCLTSSVVVLFCFGENISLEAFPMYLHFALIISLAQFSPCPGYNSKQRDVCWGRQFLRILCALIMLVSPFLSIMSSEFLKVLGNLLHNSVNKTQNVLSDLIGSVLNGTGTEFCNKAELQELHELAMITCLDTWPVYNWAVTKRKDSVWGFF